MGGGEDGGEGAAHPLFDERAGVSMDDISTGVGGGVDGGVGGRMEGGVEG